MKLIFKSLFASFLLMLCVVSFAVTENNNSASNQQNNNATQNFTDPLKSIFVTPSNPSFTIKLPANPSTGYSWFWVNVANSQLIPISHKYYPPAKKMPGAEGYDEWVFKINTTGLVVPQITFLALGYGRPWALNSLKTMNFRIVTQVPAK